MLTMMTANDTPKTQLKAVKFYEDYEYCPKFMVNFRWPDGVAGWRMASPARRFV
jgi:hypothetical protein